MICVPPLSCLFSQPQDLEVHMCSKGIQEGKELEMKRSSQIFHGTVSLQGGPEQPKRKTRGQHQDY